MSGGMRERAASGGITATASGRDAWGATLLAIAAALLASGCAGGLFKSEQKAAVVYQLRPPVGEPLAPAVPADLAVLRPFTKPGLESERIVVWLPDRRLDAYAGSRWNAPLPDLVQSLLLDELRARGGWKNVLLDRGEFRGQYVLQTEILDFQAVYAAQGEAPTVRVTLRAELGRAPSRTPVATIVGAGEVRAGADRMGEVVAAFERAYAEAAHEVASGVHAAALAAERTTERAAERTTERASERAPTPPTPSREAAR